MRKKAYVIGAMIFAALSGVAQAQSFSADLIYLDADGHVGSTQGRIHVGVEKVRVEVPELPKDYFVVDLAARIATLVRPSRHVFMDAKQSSGVTDLLVRVDPDDPCAQWQVMARVSGASENGSMWRCERLGEEMLDGRAAVKYKTVSPRGEAAVSWIDEDLHFLRKMRDGDGRELRVQGIQAGPQAEQLFEIPANYRKFDPLQLIERIKQSDVWIAPRN